MTSVSEIWGLQPALDDKAGRSHEHRMSQIEGLQEALNALIAVQEGEPTYIGDIAGLQDALDDKATAAQTSALAAAIATKAAAVHGHAIDSITGLTEALAGKAAASHGHTITNIAGLQDALDAKANAGSSSGPVAIADVTGLTDALAAKASASHGHAITDVSGLTAALAAKADPENISPTLLTYTISQSSVYGGATGTYANCTDGNFTTGAGTNSPAGQWIQATFAQNTKINQISFAGGTIPSFGATGNLMSGALIEISLDNSIWMSLAGISIGQVDDTGASRWYVFPAITARYVRIKKYASGYLGLTEFKIYG